MHTLPSPHLLGLLPPTPRCERGCHLPGLEKMAMCTGAARRVWGDYPLNEWCVSEGDSLAFIESHPSKQLLATLPLWLSLAWAFGEPLTKSFQSPSPPRRPPSVYLLFGSASIQGFPRLCLLNQLHFKCSMPHRAPQGQPPPYRAKGDSKSHP